MENINVKGSWQPWMIQHTYSCGRSPGGPAARAPVSAHCTFQGMRVLCCSHSCSVWGQLPGWQWAEAPFPKRANKAWLTHIVSYPLTPAQDWLWSPISLLLAGAPQGSSLCQGCLRTSKCPISIQSLLTSANSYLFLLMKWCFFTAVVFSLSWETNF